MGSKNGFVLKQDSQKHIFDSSKTLGAMQRPKIAKIGQKVSQKYKIAYCEAKGDSKVSKIYC